MIRLVSVSVREIFSTYPSWYYLEKNGNYDVVCTKLDVKVGHFKDKFVLRLEGTSENIQLFLDYLSSNGFKIKTFEDK